MQQQTAKFMEILPNYDQLRINELKLIEQEQYYISQLKEQRERMEVLKQEFLKKDQTITDLQIQNQKFREDLNKMRLILQEQIKHVEKEKQRTKKNNQERDQLMNDTVNIDNYNKNNLFIKNQFDLKFQFVFIEIIEQFFTKSCYIQELRDLVQHLREENDNLNVHQINNLVVTFRIITII